MKLAMIAVAGLAGVASAQTADTFSNNPARPYNAAEYRPYTGNGIGGLDAVLWDNGPLATGATSRSGVAAPAGTQWSEVFPGGTSAGSNHNGNPFRVGDDFTVSGGGWNITQLCFYGYQTGSSTTSTFTNVNWTIYAGPVGDTTNQVASGSGLDATSFTGIYRIFDSNPGTSIPGTTRPIMLNEVNVNVSLPDGNYWVAWDSAGTSASGPWAPSVTPPPGGANAQQLTTTGWTAALDGTTPLDFPFVVKGNVVPAPASLALVGLGGLIAGRRRR